MFWRRNAITIAAALQFLAPAPASADASTNLSLPNEDRPSLSHALPSDKQAERLSVTSIITASDAGTTAASGELARFAVPLPRLAINAATFQPAETSPNYGAHDSELMCLATAIYFEARGEDERGQTAVAQVVLNRVQDPNYPTTICDVVYQGEHRRNHCQFSFACDGKSDRATDRRAWAGIQALAREVFDRRTKPKLASIGGATHYHATYAHPDWAERMVRVGTIGHHVFYTLSTVRGS